MIVDEAGNTFLVYVNGIAIAADGAIYLTESSSKFGPRQGSSAEPIQPTHLT